VHAQSPEFELQSHPERKKKKLKGNHADVKNVKSQTSGNDRR
jgi:hypothetical protein